MDNYHVVGDPELAPDVPPTNVDASEVSYTNTTSGLSATNVQDAIDEVTNKSFMDKASSSTEPADMNNVVSIGTHTISPDITTLNVPVSGTWAYVEVFKHGATGLFQLWMSLNDNGMYIRTKSGAPAVWSHWRHYEHIITPSELSQYGISTSGEQINSTLEEICKKVPLYCEVKIYWTGNDATRFGTLANQIPESFGSLYIHKNGYSNPCYIEFVQYGSGNHYIRNFDYINADHLSDWVNLNTVGYAIASNEPTSKSSRAYSVGQYMVRGGNLKKVTSAIASGESITGNNTSNTTVGEELSKINSNLTDKSFTVMASNQSINLTSFNCKMFGSMAKISMYGTTVRQLEANKAYFIPNLYINGMQDVNLYGCGITRATASTDDGADSYPCVVNMSGHAVCFTPLVTIPSNYGMNIELLCYLVP